jgi:REP element-mobilizing transposase RayT
MAGFQSAVTSKINRLRGTPGQRILQRNYYDHIIRNERELFNVRQYIINNPAKWELDRENPNNWKPGL